MKFGCCLKRRRGFCSVWIPPTRLLRHRVAADPRENQGSKAGCMKARGDSLKEECKRRGAWLGHERKTPAAQTSRKRPPRVKGARVTHEPAPRPAPQPLLPPGEHPRRTGAPLVPGATRCADRGPAGSEELAHTRAPPTSLPFPQFDGILCREIGCLSLYCQVLYSTTK